MVLSAGRTTAKAAIVSLRYATVRRQGSNGNNGSECQIISYPSVHYRLLPILARAYVFTLLGRNLVRYFMRSSQTAANKENAQMYAYMELSQQLSEGKTASLPDMHAITSGLKVLVSAASVSDVEAARRSMGGHGYSAYAGLGRLYADALPSMT